ncbi:GNAT family N-acetyltransferase [Phyllobacterium sp. YR531]|uniref:GNAT family N-acetyltransferase n=1 Tax=Phyllobacterium sp. YR531 TaxID=1144343 RepID=UPI00026FAA5E|nr:GNAT family N-acetyltransferase [Phyllobacterium sp. YR531]EJM99349.1 sortase-like acyltransferase [Phyllobacterium sp. YR531]
MAAGSKILQWRPMEVSDLASVSAMASIIHTDFFEADAVYQERLALYPNGCHVLQDKDGRLIGYAITHPWRLYTMPALNSLLGEIPDQHSTYYLHDIALMPQSRGTGAAREIVSILADHAQNSKFTTMSLIAVNGSTGFWQKQGFLPDDRPELETKLRTYSDDARFMVRHLR